MKSPEIRKFQVAEQCHSHFATLHAHACCRSMHPDYRRKGTGGNTQSVKDSGIFVSAVYSREWLKKLSYTKKGYKFFSKDDYISDGKKAGFSEVVVEEIVNGRSYVIKYIKQTTFGSYEAPKWMLKE